MPAKNSRKVRYTEGEWFAVPLRDGGFATGVIARAAPRGRVLLGYFFGPRRQSLPGVGELRDFRPEWAVLVTRFGDLSLVDGTWPILGKTENWNRERWPMPDFIRTDVISGSRQRVRYDQSDPASESDVGAVVGPSVDLPKDGLMGSGSVEIKLTRLLAPE